MQIFDVRQAGTNLSFKWPSTEVETYSVWIEYDARANTEKHIIRIGFGTRHVYGRERKRVVVWINGYPHAEFLGGDDFEVSGEVLSEIRLRGEVGETMCRYPNDTIPERYSTFRTEGLPTRVNAKGVRSAWSVVINISDHKALINFAVLRQIERMR